MEKSSSKMSVPSPDIIFGGTPMSSAEREESPMPFSSMSQDESNSPVPTQDQDPLETLDNANCDQEGDEVEDEGKGYEDSYIDSVPIALAEEDVITIDLESVMNCDQEDDIILDEGTPLSELQAQNSGSGAITETVDGKIPVSGVISTPMVKVVRKRRRKRFFSANPAMAYRTRTVTKANLASQNKDAPASADSKALPVKIVQHKAKSITNSTNSTSGRDSRPMRKRTIRTPVVEPEQNQTQTKKERFIDLERPGPVLNQVHIKSILNKHTFDLLPAFYQYKLLQLLPDVDAVNGPDDISMPSTSAFTNEFFAKACEEWKTKLMAGEFVPEQVQKNRLEAEKDKSKLDPWKVKNFEPVWGMKPGAPPHTKEQRMANSETSVPSPVSKLKVELLDKTLPAPEVSVIPKTEEPIEPANESVTECVEAKVTHPPSPMNKRGFPDASVREELESKKGRLSVDAPPARDEGSASISGKQGADTIDDTNQAIDEKSEPFVTISTSEVFAPDCFPKQLAAKEEKCETTPAESKESTKPQPVAEDPCGLPENIAATIKKVIDPKNNIKSPINAPKDNRIRNGVFANASRKIEVNNKKEALQTMQSKLISKDQFIQRKVDTGPDKLSERKGFTAKPEPKATEHVKQTQVPTELIVKAEGLENETKVNDANTITIHRVEDPKPLPDAVPVHEVASEVPADQQKEMEKNAVVSFGTGLPAASQHLSISQITAAALSSDDELRVSQSPSSNDSTSTSSNHSQAMGINRKARPKAKQGKLSRTPSAPPGSVNLERSYQICQAVIQNSPNRQQLQNQLVKPPPVVVSNQMDIAMGGHQQQLQQQSLPGQQIAGPPQRRGSTPALIQANSTQMQPHLQLLRPHQKLILTHIGSPANKPVSISAHPIIAQPPISGHPGAPTQHAGLPMLKTIPSSSPAVLQSSQVKPILQSQQIVSQSYTPTGSNSATSATIITSQQLAILFQQQQQQQRQIVPAGTILQQQHCGRGTAPTSAAFTRNTDANAMHVVNSQQGQQQQQFTSTNTSNAGSNPSYHPNIINSLPPHIKIISSQYLQRLPPNSIQPLNKSVSSIPNLSQVVRLPMPIQQQKQGGKPVSQPIRARIINSVGETLTIHRAPPSMLQQVDMTGAERNGGIKGQEQRGGNIFTGFPTKVRFISAPEKTKLISQASGSRINGNEMGQGQGHSVIFGNVGANAGNSLAEFVTSQLAASNIRPISPIGLEYHRQSGSRGGSPASFMSSTGNNSPAPGAGSGIDEAAGMSGSGPGTPHSNQSTGRTVRLAGIPNTVGNPSSDQIVGNMLQDISGSDLISLNLGDDQGLDLGDNVSVALDSPYSFISEADLTSEAETIDISTKSGSLSDESSNPNIQKVYFASSPWDAAGGNSSSTTSSSSSDPILFVSPASELGVYMSSSSKPFNSSTVTTNSFPHKSLPRMQMHSGAQGVVATNKNDQVQKRDAMNRNQHGQITSNPRFDGTQTVASSSGSQSAGMGVGAVHEGLRQQYIIVHTSGSNGFPANLAVPTNSLVISSPMMLDQQGQKRSQQHENPGVSNTVMSGNTVNMSVMNSQSQQQQQQPGMFQLQDGMGGVVGQMKAVYPHASMESQMGMGDVKVLYASANPNDGQGMMIQTSAASQVQGQYILNSIMNQMDTTQYKTFKTVAPSSAIPLKGTAIQLGGQLIRCPTSMSGNANMHSQNIIHVQNPGGAAIGNQIVNIGGLKVSTQNTWNTGVVNVNMNAAQAGGGNLTATIPDTTHDGQSQAGSASNEMQGPKEQMNVKLVHYGGNGTGKLINPIILDKKGNCICDLRAMVMCRKCGVFCHDDCMSASNLCMTCTIR